MICDHILKNIKKVMQVIWSDIESSDYEFENSYENKDNNNLVVFVVCYIYSWLWLWFS